MGIDIILYCLLGAIPCDVTVIGEKNPPTAIVMCPEGVPHDGFPKYSYELGTVPLIIGCPTDA